MSGLLRLKRGWDTIQSNIRSTLVPASCGFHKKIVTNTYRGGRYKTISITLVNNSSEYLYYLFPTFSTNPLYWNKIGFICSLRVRIGAVLQTDEPTTRNTRHTSYLKMQKIKARRRGASAPQWPICHHHWRALLRGAEGTSAPQLKR